MWVHLSIENCIFIRKLIFNVRNKIHRLDICCSKSKWKTLIFLCLAKNMNKLLLYQIFIFSTLYVGYGFFYYTRKSYTYMIPYMTDTLNITKTDMGMPFHGFEIHPQRLSRLSTRFVWFKGLTISGQNLAYAISKFFGGILTDFVSARALFGSGLFLSGLLNLSINRGIHVRFLPSKYLKKKRISTTQNVIFFSE